MKHGIKILLLAFVLCLTGVASAATAPAEPDAPSAVYIWGYAGSQSVVQGGAIDLHVSTTFKSFDFVVYRYGATGLQPMQRVNGINGQWHDCPNSHLGCGWPVSYQLAVPESWRSGLYTVQLISAGGTPTKDYASWIHFVVRPKDPGSTSPVLYMLNEFTWQAYNYCNGLSFYPDTQSGRGRANYLSFNRPYCTGDQPLTPACSFEWGRAPFRNLPLIKWLESNNYAVEYAANYDVHSDPTLLSHYRFFMDDAHDEYWSWPMRDQAEDFIARGGNAAFFSSNTSFWQVRLEDAGRTLVGFKNEVGRDPVLLDNDPTNDRLATTNWCVSPVNRCETQMLGITYFNGGNGKAKSCSYCSGGFQAWHPAHWIWAGTGIKSGQLFGDKDAYGSSVGIAATEVDGALWQMVSGVPKITQAAINQGTPANFEILAHAIAWPYLGSVRNAAGTMGVYTNTAGATVWVTGSWDWAAVGLAAKNPIVERVTRNVLNKLAFGAPWPETRTLSQPLGSGWNLVSMPYTPADSSVPAVLSAISGQYDLVEAYDGCRTVNSWRIYDPAAPPFVNTLTQVDTSTGLWVHTTSGVTLTLTGKPPASDVTLALCAGWNLIGYPSGTERDVAAVLAPINGKFDLVEGYDGANPGNPWLIYDPAAPPFVNTLARLQPGKGYWIHMTAAGSLTIAR